MGQVAKYLTMLGSYWMDRQRRMDVIAIGWQMLDGCDVEVKTRLEGWLCYPIYSKSLLHHSDVCHTQLNGM